MSVAETIRSTPAGGAPSHPSVRADAVTLTAQVQTDAPAAALRPFVIPVYDEVRAGGAQADVVVPRLFARSGPLVLRLRVAAGERARAESALQAAAAAAGLAVQVAPDGTGPEPLLGDHPAAREPALGALAFSCLARGTEVLLSLPGVRDQDEPPYAPRQSALLELILAGLATALPDAARRRDYLAYHRDWLVRHPVLTSGLGLSRAHQMLDLLEGQAVQMGSPDAAALNTALGGVVNEAGRGGWTAAVRELAGHADAQGADAAYAGADPFTADPAFPVLFRVFHATALQLGVRLLDEAFLHHLVLRTLGGGDRERFLLAPHLQAVPETGGAAGGEPATSVQEGYWFGLVARSGDEGRAWSQLYAASDDVVGPLLQRGLQAMRAGRADEGRQALAEVQAHRESIRAQDPGVYHVLGRFYHGQRAYYEYLTGNQAAAEREMDAAAQSVRLAVETYRFLLPVAPLVVDIPLQKARIARRRRDWGAMERHLEEMYEIETGVRPLFRLTDGTTIDYPLLAGHLAGLPLDEPRRASADALVSPERRLREFRRLTTRLYAPPGLVVMT